jgi:uncharacterized iron-regulated membrane protein
MLRIPPIPRIARTVHAWAGVALSLLVIVIASSGAALVWKDEYLKLTFPEAGVAFDPTPEALTRIAEGAEAALGADNIAYIFFATEDLGLSEVMLIDESMAYLDVEGRVVDRWAIGGRPEDWLYELHHRLLMETTGLYVAGFAGFAVAVLAVAGLVAWWPTRWSIRLGVWPRGTGRPALLASHRNIGAIMAVPIVLAVLCGAGLAFPDTARATFMFRVRHDVSYGENFVDGMDDLSGAEVAGWGPALARAQAVFPGATIRTATFPAGAPPYRTIRLQQPGAWNRQGDSIVYVDGFEGYMDVRIDAQTLPPEEQLFNTLYPVHTAGLHTLGLGNIVYKLYVFAIGVALTALGVLGLWAFAQRLRPGRGDAA